jgi:hypothetical protein
MGFFDRLVCREVAFLPLALDFALAFFAMMFPYTVHFELGTKPSVPTHRVTCADVPSHPSWSGLRDYAFLLLLRLQLQ